MGEFGVPTMPQSDLLFQHQEPLGVAKFFLASSINMADSNLSAPPSKHDDTLTRNTSYLMQWMNNKTIDTEHKFNKRLLHLVSLIASAPIGDSSRSQIFIHKIYKYFWVQL